MHANRIIVIADNAHGATIAPRSREEWILFAIKLIIALVMIAVGLWLLSQLRAG